jgi:hypothetical protein
MNALRRFKAWWIADCPDDVARISAARDRAFGELARAESQIQDLTEALENLTVRYHKTTRRAEHYRNGWRMGAPFLEYNEGTVPDAAEPSKADTVQP